MEWWLCMWLLKEGALRAWAFTSTGGSTRFLGSLG